MISWVSGDKHYDLSVAWPSGKLFLWNREFKLTFPGGRFWRLVFVTFSVFPANFVMDPAVRADAVEWLKEQGA